MASFVIEGGHRLSGDIYPQGAKNEVLQIICATLLTAEEVTVHNIPDILDVNNLIQLMRDMGVSVSKKGIDTYSFQAANIDFAYLESDAFLKKCSSLRGSVMLVGPMVARFGKAMISKVRRLYPEANIVAIDYDPGAARVNQENRIKLMLSIARENLEKETNEQKRS